MEPRKLKAICSGSMTVPSCAKTLSWPCVWFQTRLARSAKRSADLDQTMRVRMGSAKCWSLTSLVCRCRRPRVSRRAARRTRTFCRESTKSATVEKLRLKSLGPLQKKWNAGHGNCEGFVCPNNHARPCDSRSDEAGPRRRPRQTSGARNAEWCKFVGLAAVAHLGTAEAADMAIVP